MMALQTLSPVDLAYILEAAEAEVKALLEKGRIAEMVKEEEEVAEVRSPSQFEDWVNF